jgi:hypothetical protein
MKKIIFLFFFLAVLSGYSEEYGLFNKKGLPYSEMQVLNPADSVKQDGRKNNTKVSFPFNININEDSGIYFSQFTPFFSSCSNGELATSTPEQLVLDSDMVIQRGFVAPANMTLTNITAWAMCLSPGQTPTLRLNVYIYSPASGTFQNTKVTGVLANSQSMTIASANSENSIAEFNYSPDIQVQAGQIIIIWANSSINSKSVINGTVLLQATGNN